MIQIIAVKGFDFLEYLNEFKSFILLVCINCLYIHNGFQIYWCCKEASLGLPCKSPAGNKLLADIYPDNLKNLTLSLPPSTLAVGM